MSVVQNILYLLRNIRSRKVFKYICKYCKGSVLDVGSWDFYFTLKKKRIVFDSYTALDVEKDRLPNISDPNFKYIVGDGCNMQFRDNTFDSVINVQVLEHVYEPILMVKEISRVLKPSGYAVFLIPQTSTIHMVPYHYYNFTRFWIEKTFVESGLQVVELVPLGGRWSSMASHLFYFFMQSMRADGQSCKSIKRNIFFYLLLPFMFLYGILNIPILMIFSMGDLNEEPNNHLVLARKI